MSSKAYKTIILIIVYIALLLLFKQHIPEFIKTVQQHHYLAPILFALLYCMSALLCAPTIPFVFACGAIFGPIFGTLISLTSATMSAMIAFLMSRHLGKKWLSSEKHTAIYDVIRHTKYQGFKSLALLRLTPAPFSLVNYGFGLTQIKFSLYAVTTFFFLLPYKILVTYSGYLSSLLI